MRILFVSSDSPAPLNHHGASQNLLDMIKTLSVKHDISVLTFCCSDEEKRRASELRRYCRRIETVVLPPIGKNQLRRRLTTLLTGKPAFVTFCKSHEMSARLAELTRQESFDVIQFQSTEMAQYVDYVSSPSRAATVLHEIDVSLVRFYREFKAEEDLARKGYKLKDYLNMMMYEPTICERFDGIIACSQQDAGVLRAFNSRVHVSVIPFGVDDSYFGIESDGNAAPSMLFVGSYVHPPNVDAVLYFCKEILPKVRDSSPHVTLYITGGSPPDAIRRLSSDPGIVVTGYVEDLGESLRRATVCIAPLRFGAGQKTKVLAAMAAGKAIVSTRLGVESLAVVPDRDVLVADSPAEFAGKVVRLLNDPPLRSSLGASARRLISEQHSWNSNVARLEAVYSELAARKARGAEELAQC